jgi:hypothetical protein
MAPSQNDPIQTRTSLGLESQIFSRILPAIKDKATNRKSGRNIERSVDPAGKDCQPRINI